MKIKKQALIAGAPDEVRRFAINMIANNGHVSATWLMEVSEKFPDYFIKAEPPAPEVISFAKRMELAGRNAEIAGRKINEIFLEEIKNKKVEDFEEILNRLKNESSLNRREHINR